MPDSKILKYSNFQIINELRAGNINALAYLAFRYLKILSRYAHYFTRNPHTSDILAAKALEQLWEHRAQMETHRSVHTFLYQQIYQQVCNWFRERVIDIDIPAPASFKNIKKP